MTTLPEMKYSCLALLAHRRRRGSSGGKKTVVKNRDITPYEVCVGLGVATERIKGIMSNVSRNNAEMDTGEFTPECIQLDVPVLGGDA